MTLQAQNALLKTKHDKNRQGQHKRMAKTYADKFFNQFLRKELFGCTIRRIELKTGGLDSSFHQKDVSDVDFDKSFDIIMSIGNGELITLSYNNQTDSVDMGGDEIVTITRADAILLSKMISGYAPETKFKVNNIHQNFVLRNNVNESKLNKIIEQHIRKALKDLK